MAAVGKAAWARLCAQRLRDLHACAPQVVATVPEASCNASIFETQNKKRDMEAGLPARSISVCISTSDCGNRDPIDGLSDGLGWKICVHGRGYLYVCVARNATWDARMDEMPLRSSPHPRD